MKRSIGFWAIFFGAPSSEMLGAFILGVLVVGLLGDLCYELLTGAVLKWQTIGSIVLVSGLMTGAGYGLYRRAQRQTRIEISVDESQLAPGRRGVIWLFGPNYDHLLTALRHHRDQDGAEHCWLILQDAPALRIARNNFLEALAEEDLETKIHSYFIQTLDTRSAYEAVRTIIRRELAEASLTPDEVIADLTSGIKPLTAGMVLAALTEGVELEYVQSQRDEQGYVIDGTQEVILLDMDFYLARERPSPGDNGG
jgi:hypothetical protein